MVQKIRNEMECASECYAATQHMSSCSNNAKEMCKICADFFEVCRAECMKDATIKHCQEYAEACTSCREKCRIMEA